jgi:GNAT superfamily N-acetyltransferase
MLVTSWKQESGGCGSDRSDPERLVTCESSLDARRSADAQSTTELYLRTRRAAAARGAIPPLVHRDDEVTSWVWHFVIPRLDCWVAERSPSTVVGMLVFEEEWIDQLYVDPELTGAGIGADLIAVAKRERPEGLRLWTFVSNEGAQRFYLRHGFREVERTDGSRNEEGAPYIQYAWAPPRRAPRSRP